MLGERLAFWPGWQLFMQEIAKHGIFVDLNRFGPQGTEIKEPLTESDIWLQSVSKFVHSLILSDRCSGSQEKL
jgi:hypothetical protein